MTTSPNPSAPAQLEPAIETVPATCDTHGPYAARLLRLIGQPEPMKLGCPACAEERRARDERHKAKLAAAEHDAKIRALFDRSGIPERFRDRKLGNYDAQTEGQRRALTIAERFVASDERGVSLVFCGRPGTGKTHLACGIAAALIESMRSALFCTVLSAVRHVKETYHKDSEKTEAGALDDLMRSDLLILDEVGVQVGSEHEKMILFEIINERYQNCRSTILISNLSREALTDYLGERIMDRFRESGAVVAFDWQSYRGSRAA